MVCPWDSPGKNTGVGCHSLLQGNLPNPEIESRSPALQADSLLPEPPGKLTLIGAKISTSKRVASRRRMGHLVLVIGQEKARENETSSFSILGWQL